MGEVDPEKENPKNSVLSHTTCKSRKYHKECRYGWEPPWKERQGYCELE